MNIAIASAVPFKTAIVTVGNWGYTSTPVNVDAVSGFVISATKRYPSPSSACL